MPGVPPPGALEELRQLHGRAFEERFFTLMLPHHRGAVQMATGAIDRTRDPRLILFAHNVRHTQRIQITQMAALRHVVAQGR